MRVIVWFRGKDLRVADHAPLAEASGAREVIPLVVLDPEAFTPERVREMPHHVQFLLDALLVLQRSIANLGSRLVVVRGKSADVIPHLFRNWQVDRLLAHRRVEPSWRKVDERLRDALGSAFELHEGETLLPPGTLRTGAGRPYAVFTQFARSFRAATQGLLGKPSVAPSRLPPLPKALSGDFSEIPSVEQLGLSRNTALQGGGEEAAQRRLRHFVNGAAAAYAQMRDRMDLAGTSRLSADLKFGTLSARQVWTAVESLGEKADAFRNELVWREFCYSTLWDRPELLQKPFRSTFEGFPWQYDEKHWQAWVLGKTGHPIVDAASRQLLGEGFVHNRARMVSASFLCKHLLIDYRRGEKHYMKYLTDGDSAQNNAGWQWSAGCGCDAQPYFRVFNPVTQGEKFDPEGNYVRRWVPELAALPAKYIHNPWAAPADVLRAANVRLGDSYPLPIVEHASARERFLAMAAGFLKRVDR
ncbi:MAG: cryptochrome/photolyase family protein [Myxococcaceae bacterium]